MPRLPRIHYPGAVYHAMSRGVEGREIFLDDCDRTSFCRMLLEAKKSNEFHVFAYCLMGNHFHLLVQTGRFPLCFGMHQLLTSYSRYFNRRHDRAGHLFQSRYTAPLCRQDSYLEILLRYIHLNPVRAGLVENPADWIWSGHRGLVGLIDDRLLDLPALAALREESPFQLRASYLESLSPNIETSTFSEYAPETNRAGLVDIPSLPILIDTVARDFGLSGTELRAGNRGKRHTQAKSNFIEKARGQGHSLRAIAALLRCSPAAITQMRKRKS